MRWECVGEEGVHWAWVPCRRRRVLRGCLWYCVHKCMLASLQVGSLSIIQRGKNGWNRFNFPSLFVNKLNNTSVIGRPIHNNDDNDIVFSGRASRFIIIVVNAGVWINL